MMRALRIAAGLGSLCLWFTSYRLWMRYADLRQAPPADGSVSYPLYTHGGVSYLSPVQHYILYGTMIAAGLFFVICGIAYLMENWPGRVE